MRKLATLFLFALPLYAGAEVCYQIEELPSSTRISDFDYKCVGPNSTDVSNHVRPDKAWESCNQTAQDQVVAKALAGDYVPGDVVESDGHYVRAADYRIVAKVRVVACQEPTPPPVCPDPTPCPDCPVCPDPDPDPVSYVPLKVDPAGRYFTRGGEPFFWIGDTAWKASQNLTTAEATVYLQDVVARGFNVVQGPIFMAGEVLPPWGSGADDPISSLNPTTFKSPHIDRIDHFIKTASDLGLVVAVPLVWGPHSNRYFEKDAARAAEYVTQIVSRYSQYANLVVIVSGEYHKVKWISTTDPWSGEWDKSQANQPLTAQERAMFVAMGNAARAAAHPEALISIHPEGNLTPGDDFHGESWYSFPMLQAYKSLLSNRDLVRKEVARVNPLPVVQAENMYEVWPYDPATGDNSSWEVRQSFYACYLSGCAGHTYGNRSIWQFLPDWEQALEADGRIQVSSHFRTFVADTFRMDLIPDQTLLANGQGWPPNNNAVYAMRTPDYSRILVYTSKGTTPRVRTNQIPGGEQASGRWFDPRTGTYSAPFPVNKTSDGVWINAPTQGDEQDYALVIDSTPQTVATPEPIESQTGVLSVNWKPSNLNEDGTPSEAGEQSFTLYYGTQPRQSTRGKPSDYPFKVEVPPGNKSVKVPVKPGIYYVAMTASHPAAAIPEDPKGEGFLSNEVKVVVK